MTSGVPVEIQISRWERREQWRYKPSMNELVSIHHYLHQKDRFAQVMSFYPYGKDTVANAIKELVPRKDYEFFLARVKPSNEILGWVAISFESKENKVESRDKYEAKLEWTEMCSPTLKHWDAHDAGKHSNVWDSIKRVSSSLQAIHLPRDHCIINTFVLYPEFERMVVADKLLEHVIEFWRNCVMVGTEWAIWVQAPPYISKLYESHGFEVVGEYTVDLGEYGFLPKEKRSISGTYVWKFLVLRGSSGSATGELESEPDAATESDEDEGEEQTMEDVKMRIAARPHDEIKSKEQPLQNVGKHDARRELDKGKSKNQRQDIGEENVPARRPDNGKSKQPALEDAEESVTPQNVDKGKGKEQRLDDLRLHENKYPVRAEISANDTEIGRAWDEAEQRLDEIRCRRGLPPLPGEVARLITIQSRAEIQGLDPKAWSKSKGVEKPVEVVRYPLPAEPLARPLQPHSKTTGQRQDNYEPSTSEEDLIDVMRKGGVDEEEIELVKAMAFSLSDEAKGG